MRAPAAILGLTFTLFAAVAAAAPAGTHFANADDPALVETGGAVYSRTCASCHGRHLQGQPLWQLIDQYAGRRAPAQDATGHTWQHSDEDLFHMTKFGRFPSAPPRGVSYMPAFAGHLSDREILAAIAFIKAGWPVGIRASQAMLNPGMAGMPKGADRTSWTLPPNCTGTFQRWSASQAK